MGAGMGAGMDDPVAATQTTLARLADLVGPDRMRFTAALANGRDLYAFRYAMNNRANTLYYRESEQSIVVVSEPLDKDHHNWTPVPESHVLVAKAGWSRRKSFRFSTSTGKQRSSNSCICSVAHDLALFHNLFAQTSQWLDGRP